jgi:hypothetical protein
MSSRVRSLAPAREVPDHPVPCDLAEGNGRSHLPLRAGPMARSVRRFATELMPEITKRCART